MRETVVVCSLVAMVAGVGCATDKAKANYEKCLAADKAGDLEAAWKACLAASWDDPKSPSGKAAAAKLEEMRPRRRQIEADQEAAASRKRAARVQTLRGKVTAKYAAPGDPDPICTGHGMPPYRWFYEGGTFAEDAEVATADGCQQLMTESTIFCCPRKPTPW